MVKNNFHNYVTYPETIGDINTELENITGNDVNFDPLIDNGDKEDEDNKAKKDEKVKSFIDNLLTWGEKGASIIEKIRGTGATIYDEGDKYEIYPEDKEDKKADKMVKNWLIGGAVFIALGITTLLIIKNSKKKHASKS